MVKFKISKKLLIGCLTTFAAIAAAKATIRSAIASPQQLCPHDRPCFHYAYPQKSGNKYIALKVVSLQIAGAKTEFTFEEEQEEWWFAGGAGLDGVASLRDDLIIVKNEALHPCGMI
jgi:hypothetical protein